MNYHKQLLSCWHKLEHFNPPIVNHHEKSIRRIESEAPWQNQIRLKDTSKTREYVVYLGVIEDSHVTEFIKNYFDDDTKDENHRSARVCYATINIDENGNYIPDSFVLPTLIWSLCQLENDKITNDKWDKDFKLLFNKLNDEATIILKPYESETDETNNGIPIQQLEAFQDKIESLINWSVKPEKEIFIKTIIKNKSNKDTPVDTATILNSFYISDLERIIKNYDESSLPKAFEEYLNGCLNIQSYERYDIVQDIDRLKRNLSPIKYPNGCWPSDYTLSLMQQFAVNTIFNGLSDADQSGMFSVNGPPGTGKTTLLRDIIAPIIVKRAKELIKEDEPYKAFKCITKKKPSDGFVPFVYEPKSNLIHGGIVISSSNNGAVENISTELPSKKEISETYRSDIAYFKKVAENCLDNGYWGIISAVLGNKSNRNNLKNNLWVNRDENNLKQTLKQGSNISPSLWDEIRKEFKNKLNEVSEEKQRLEEIKNDAEAFETIDDDLNNVNLIIESIKLEKKRLFEEIEKDKKIVAQLKEDRNHAAIVLSAIESTKPNILVRIFLKSKWEKYKEEVQDALDSFNELSNKLKIKSNILTKNEIERDELQELLNRHEQQKEHLESEKHRLEIGTTKAKEELGSNYADVEFWNNIESKQSQEACPWYSKKLKKLQSELFILSLKVNEIFILMANSKSNRIATTMDAFFDYLNGNSNAEKEEIKAMWNTFFLIIPVISSTFSSIQSMFKDLDQEDLPWLFIDEAGQAVPQAAAGAIWRSKRVAVVGDPFQIEPVVTVSEIITNNISTYFDLNSDKINSELSVQSMADRINPLGTYLTSNGKKSWIGMPLRVHRRCINPMFNIANKIAYDNTMYCSTLPPKEVKVKFETSFIHCKGSVSGKHFVKEQAEIIKNILIEEGNFKEDKPDIFVISPFSEISIKLKSYIKESISEELHKHKNIDLKELNTWLNKRIGTVHTFQGKQANGVILCLGLDEKTTGAAKWAAQKPNLLNVAITRAKHRFIAIGDKDIWLKQNYFNELKELELIEEKLEKDIAE